MGGKACFEFLGKARADRFKKKSHFAKGDKEYILGSAKEAVRTRGKVTAVCEFFGISRPSWYGWKKKEETGTLENKKPIAKSYPKKISKEKEMQIVETAIQWLDVSSWYAVAILNGVCAMSVGKILKNYGLLTKEEEEKLKRGERSYEWLRKDVCWTIDTKEIKFNKCKLYLQILKDEYSRKPLGWCLGLKKDPGKIAELIKRVIKVLGRKPLIIKYDRGTEFNNRILKACLEEEQIIVLISPRHYPQFNSKHENGNKIVDKFIKRLEKKEKTAEGLKKAIEEAIDWEVNILPRMIFKGKTSRQVYDEAESYTEEDRVRLHEVLEKKRQEVMKQEENKKRDLLDLERICVVKSVVELKLCEVKTEGENANQLSA